MYIWLDKEVYVRLIYLSTVTISDVLPLKQPVVQSWLQHEKLS